MVRQSGTFVLSVSGHSDSANVVLCFTEPISWTAKICKYPATPFYILCCNGLVEKLWQDILAAISVHLLRSLPACIAVSFRSVHYRSGYVSESGDNQFERGAGTAGQSDTCHRYCGSALYTCINSGNHIHCTQTQTVRSIHPASSRRTLYVLSAGILSLGTAYLTDDRYEPKSELYPANVCYNIALAFQRTAQTRNYHKTSKDFTFHARSTHQADEGKYM